MIIRCHKTGKDAAGLTRYLFGPGKANEHTNQRMVAGSPELTGEWAGQTLSMREATHLGRVVEASWRRQYAPVLAMAGLGEGGISREALHSDITARVAAGQVDGAVHHDLSSLQDHVFHASLSLRPDEAPLTDDQWNEVASKYVEAMGFTNVDGRPDCSWFAVNHGTSAQGSDHIHVVVCATRRDGTRVDLHNTGRRSQTVRRDVIERLPYVQALHDPDRAEYTPRPHSYTAAEHNIARDRATRGDGPATPDRVLLQRIVRAAATEATTEAGFINNVIKNPHMEIVAARWQPGTDKQVVTGYKIRAAGRTWFSASSLAPDLTLSKLRGTWTQETDATRSYARALWAEQAAGERQVATPDVPAQLEHAAAELANVNDALAQLDPSDVGAWSHVEAAAAGATAVLSTAAPHGVDDQGRSSGFGIDAGRASDVLTRQWLADNFNQPDPAPQIPAGLSGMELATRHMQLAIRASGTDRHNGWAAVIQQLTRTIDAIAGAKQARNDLVAAETLRRDAIGAMTRLEEWLTTRADHQRAATVPNVPASPDLSDAARAAREASGHARTSRPDTQPPTAPQAQQPRVDRVGPINDRSRGRRTP